MGEAVLRLEGGSMQVLLVKCMKMGSVARTVSQPQCLCGWKNVEKGGWAVEKVETGLYRSGLECVRSRLIVWLVGRW